jgi:hypothetical protein
MASRPGLLAKEWVAWFSVWWHCLWRVFLNPPHQMCALYEIDPKRTTHFCSCGFGNGGVTWEQVMKSRYERECQPACSKLIVVNGVEKRTLLKVLSYEDVVWLAGLPSGYNYSMTYKVPRTGPGGILSPGKSVAIQEGMVFNIADTGNA